jgi:ADP-heptose:LPS heptosyltransferase
VVRFVPARRRSRHLLLIKPDEIGDYMLIRNLLPLFKQAGPYKDHHITLVGNAPCRQLFEHYDHTAADEVIWLDKKRFKKDLLYRLKFLLRIRRAGASDAISLIYSRSYRLDDMMMAVSGAVNRVGMACIDQLVSGYERWLTPRHLYTRLIGDTGERTLFDASRNTRFVEQLLGLQAVPVSTAIEAPGEELPFSLPAGYVVIFPGAGNPDKRWSSTSFSTVAKHMVDRYGLLPVVCGSPTDAADTRGFIEVYGGPVVDLTGKTTLIQMLTVLKQAACLISVDTGAVHLAAAVQCPVFALYSGLHYGRFGPYPPSLAPRFHAVYPDEIDEQLAKGGPPPDDTIPMDGMKKITPEKMIAAIDAHFPVWQNAPSII